jgi:cytochrome c peroxidase
MIGMHCTSLYTPYSLYISSPTLRAHQHSLYTFAGVVAVEEAGGPKVKFQLGREDMESGASSPPDGRLPDADKGSRVKTIQHVRDIFGRMGFNDQEIVALSGAHAMGRCHTTASGYWGPWTNAENTFSNEYYRLLVEERWSPVSLILT